jgi:hypothetical protein
MNATSAVAVVESRTPLPHKCQDQCPMRVVLESLLASLGMATLVVAQAELLIARTLDKGE